MGNKMDGEKWLFYENIAHLSYFYSTILKLQFYPTILMWQVLMVVGSTIVRKNGEGKAIYLIFITLNWFDIAH